MRPGIAAVAAVVLATSLALAGCSGDSDPDSAPGPSTGARAAPPTAASSASAAPMPQAPEGTRWQGGNGVVVAVPEDWDTITEVCAPPDGDAVRYLNRAQLVALCPHRGGSRTHSVLLVALDRVTAGMIAGRLPLRTEVRGLEVHSSRARCRVASPGGCTLTFAVPDAGVVFQLRYRGPDQRSFVGALRGSVTELPAAFTTVPAVRYGVSPAAATRQLEAAGLVAQAPDADFPHYVTGTVPPAGSPVATGATVELTIGDG